MRRVVLSIFLAAMAVLAACNNISGSDSGLARFTVERDSEAPDDPPVVTATVVGGAVTIRGSATTSCVNYGLEADGDRAGQEVRVRIRWRRSGTCATVFGKFRYQAELEPLTAGTYRIRVEQPVFNAPNRWDVTTVFDQQVTVP